MNRPRGWFEDDIVVVDRHSNSLCGIIAGARTVRYIPDTRIFLLKLPVGIPSINSSEPLNGNQINKNWMHSTRFEEKSFTTNLPPLRPSQIDNVVASQRELIEGSWSLATSGCFFPPEA